MYSPPGADYPDMCSVTSPATHCAGSQVHCCWRGPQPRLCCGDTGIGSDFSPTCVCVHPQSLLLLAQDPSQLQESQ